MLLSTVSFKRQAAVHLFLSVLSPCIGPWLLNGIEEEAFNKYLKFPIDLFVFWSFVGGLAVSQELMQLREGGATVMMQLLREDRQKGNV